MDRLTRPAAALDIGTNSLLLTVAEARGARLHPLAEACRITRLGEGVDGTGRLAPEAVARTLAAAVELVEIARKLGAGPIRVVGTSALRSAADHEAFAARLAEATGGLAVEVLSGEAEARLMALATRREFAGLDPLLIADPGGGSTELALVAGERLAWHASVELGCVRLRERFLAPDPPDAGAVARARAACRAAFATLAPPTRGDTLVGVAGTVTTLAMLALGLDRHDPEAIHGTTLSRADLERWRERLLALDDAGRRALPGVPAGRADVIHAGALLLAELAAHLGIARVVVSDRGLRWGVLYETLTSSRRGPS